MLKNKKVIVGISGSIAAYKSYDLIRALQKENVDIRCVVTDAGMQFVNKLTLESLLQDSIYTDLFGDYPEKRAIHIALAEWADLVMIVPASADIMAKAAVGLADDLLSSIMLATQAKIVLVPAMHSNMWNHPCTQENVKKLETRGYSFIGPAMGMLADGSHGIGHISSLETILETMKKIVR
jgi:phosphopantothenoylcysteine decarboxylase/phosphopantothenate--cysteine ligase